MKRILIVLSILFSSSILYSQCIIDGTLYTGTPKSAGIKVCNAIIQSLTDGMVKSHGDSLKTAIAGTDYASPLAGVVSVTDYGAIGDGVTNNATAFAAARNAAGVGGTVIVPAGVYLQTSLTLNIAGQLWNIDPAGTIKITSSSVTSVIITNASGITITGGGTIDGNQSGVSSSAVAGIYTNNSASTNLIVDNI